MKNRFISILLSLSMLLSFLPNSAWATESNPTPPEEDEITISADATRTVTIKEKEPEPAPEPEPGPIVRGTLQLSELNHTIQRDYEQNCAITVRNTTGAPQEFYLEVDNGYDDLSMEIIQNGSKGNPAIIGAGENLQVTLTVFAQNATREQYTIPITAYVFTDGEYQESTKKQCIYSASIACNPCG